MPYAKLVHETPPELRALRNRLAQEWETPTQNADAPIIIEENDPLRQQVAPQHLYVIWEAWRDLSPQERAEMIMDAYDSVKGRPMAMQVTMAMGLTPSEADKLHLHYEPIAANNSAAV